jgi:UDP-4-amino-4,6-dideoxy-N-acetyl-beta-L-altrosamine transaminase
LSSKNNSFLPYGKHYIDDDDINAVTEVLKSNWLTTGPKTEEFERMISEKFGVRQSISCANGTAALHLAAKALNLKEGDAVVVPAMTFVATANAVRYTGADIIFADVDPENGLMTKESFRDALSKSENIKAVFPVHLNGQLVDMKEISILAKEKGIKIVEDSCHAIGSKYAYKDLDVPYTGNCIYSDMTVFSLHPVKNITSGEGGVVCTNNEKYAKLIRKLRNHEIVKDPENFINTNNSKDNNNLTNPWYYEVHDLGFNYKLSDIHCALGLSQLKKLDKFTHRRDSLVLNYDKKFKKVNNIIKNIKRVNTCFPAWHLYPVHIDFDRLRISKAKLMELLLKRNIGTQVHYIPLHFQPYYMDLYKEIYLPGSEKYYNSILSLPLYVTMTDEDITYICDNIIDIINSNLNE